MIQLLTRPRGAFSFAAFILSLILAGGALAADTANYQPLSPGAGGPAGRRTPIVAAIEKARPAVVSVYAQIAVRGGSRFSRDPFQDEFFNRFFDDMWQRRARPGISLGSGVIIDGAEGMIVTNEHVVRNAEKITVTLSGGAELSAEVVGADPRYDLALLKVKSKNSLPSLSLGNSEDLMIGETVIAIGNPFGFSHTATTGVVSATDRTVSGDRSRTEPLRNLIQTDASINPGNSGGPLLNINGEIIGINTAIIAGADGLGFAIPASHIKRISARLIRGDQAAAMDLGLDLAEAGKPKRGETGCLIISVEPGGPADRAGMKKGDMLMKLDGSPTATLSDYEMILSSLISGRSVAAEILRGDKPVNLKVGPQQFSEDKALDLSLSAFGIKVEEYRGRLVLKEPPKKSPAASLGLREGDMLLSFGGRELTGKSDLAKAVIETRFKSAIPLTIQRGRVMYQSIISR